MLLLTRPQMTMGCSMLIVIALLCCSSWVSAAVISQPQPCSLNPDADNVSDHSLMTSQRPETIISHHPNDSVVLSQESATPLQWPIRLLSWNIQKLNHVDWREDFRLYARNSNLVLLQEATEQQAITEQVERLHFYSLAPGYVDGDRQTGVMTASRVPALSTCYKQYKEPWLRTPKAAQFSWFSLADSKQTLLVVNVHSINFDLGVSEYLQQLDGIMTILANHRGPLIVSGDFNSWSQERLSLLETTTNTLRLTEVTFSGDKRSRFLGNVLDHIFIRGLIVKNSYILETESSDHNPLFAELRLAD